MRRKIRKGSITPKRHAVFRQLAERRQLRLMSGIAYAEKPPNFEICAVLRDINFEICVISCGKHDYEVDFLIAAADKISPVGMKSSGYKANQSERQEGPLPSISLTAEQLAVYKLFCTFLEKKCKKGARFLSSSVLLVEKENKNC